MFISSVMISEFQDRYGKPLKNLNTSFEMDQREFTNLIKSQKHDRSHDFTFFIRKDNSWIVNAKPWYPKGLYRIPSGGIKPDESIEEGIFREIYEETGCDIILLKYFMKINVRFTCGNEYVDWVSYLILADWKSGKIQPVDTVEIKEARLAKREEFENFGKIMLSMDVGGLHYREYLHRKAFTVLDNI